MFEGIGISFNFFSFQRSYIVVAIFDVIVRPYSTGGNPDCAESHLVISRWIEGVGHRVLNRYILGRSHYLSEIFTYFGTILPTQN